MGRCSDRSRDRLRKPHCRPDSFAHIARRCRSMKSTLSRFFRVPKAWCLYADGVGPSTLGDDKLETRCASHARLGVGPGLGLELELDVTKTCDVQKVKKRW
jgi:hypothetical protein